MRGGAASRGIAKPRQGDVRRELAAFRLEPHALHQPLELGANDALRGIDPKLTRAALDAILRRLAERRVTVLLAGMRAPRNMGAAYVEAFDAIFPELASTFGVVFYPFFLDGVAADRTLNQPDGLHPTAAGIDAIVARMLPKVEELVARVRTARGS